MDTLNRYTLYIGLNNMYSKIQEVSTEDAQRTVNRICGDNTTQVVKGHYTHEDGTQVDETTLKVELLFKDDASVRLMCQDLKRELQQESIAVSKSLEMSALL